MGTGMLDPRAGTPGYAEGQKFTAGPELVGAGPVFCVTGNMDRVFGTGGAVLCEHGKLGLQTCWHPATVLHYASLGDQHHLVSLVPFLQSGPECPV